MNNIPWLDLSRQDASIKEEIKKRIAEVIDKGTYVLGPQVAEFEQGFAKFIGTKHAIGLASGTDAIELSLKALGVGYGDEVILPAWTFIATAEAVSYLGAKPVFVDVDEYTYCISPSAIKKAITPKTKTIIAVHLYGHPADMDAIFEAVKGTQIHVLEDCAQAHGAVYKGKNIGTMGICGSFSFYPSKNLGAYGDAGAVCTNDDELAAKIKVLRDHGQPQKNLHTEVGYNSRLDSFQAAVLSVKLTKIAEWNQKRRQVAVNYDKELKGTKVTIPPHADWATPVYHLYAIQAPQREQLITHLKEKGIGTAIHYPSPCHLQPVYSYLGHSKGSFPVAEKLGESILSIPMFPGLTQEEINRVSEAIKEFYK